MKPYITLSISKYVHLFVADEFLAKYKCKSRVYSNHSKLCVDSFDEKAKQALNFVKNLIFDIKVLSKKTGCFFKKVRVVRVKTVNGLRRK